MVLVTVNNGPPSSDRMKAVLGPTQDWLRFAPGAWLVYTSLGAAILRDRLRAEFTSQDPSILVMKLDAETWAAYASATIREWVKSDHSNMTGE
jgi:hypothetical protein